MLKDIKHWKTDVPSGLVVFLVAIPLCLGIALASGSSAMSGIIAGIVGGLIVTLFSNSSLGVSGPAAGLVAIVAPAIVSLGFQNFLLAVVIAGAIQFLLGMFKAGTIGYYFPSSVIKGMLAAIGLIIILKQIPHALGNDKDYEGDLAFLQADGENTFSNILNAYERITPSAFIITLVCLAILILWETKFMKKMSFTKIIQGPLVAVVAGILLNLGFDSVESMKLEKDHLVRLPVWKIQELPEDSIELDEPTKAGQPRFQTRSIVDGPVVYQGEDGMYYHDVPSNEPDSKKKGLAKLPPESTPLDESTEAGQPRFKLRIVKNGDVYYKGEDGVYHLDAPVLFFPHFKPEEITSGEVQLGHGSHDDSSSHSEEEPDFAEAETKLDSLAEKVGKLSDDQAAEIAPMVSGLRETLTALSGSGAAEKTGDVSPIRAGYLIFLTAMTLAIVASLESLLCAEATDKLDPQRRQTDLNKELRAQGIGNFFSALIGGLPVTQVIVRSSTNIQSGAQSRLAAFVHGIFLIVCVIAIPHVLNLVPLASLAAILFVVGYKLAHPSKFRAMFSQGWNQFLPFIITIAAILRTDLLIGIGIGLFASLFFILKSSYFKSFWVSAAEEGGKKVHKLTLAERVFFINKANIQTALQKIEPGSKLVIDNSNTISMDQDVLDVFEDFKTHADFEKIEIEWANPPAVGERKDPARVENMVKTDS